MERTLETTSPGTAHNIRAVGLCRVSGQHLSQAPNEPGTFAEIHEQTQAEARAIVRGDVDAAMHADKQVDGYALRKLRSAIALERRQQDVSNVVGSGW